MDNRIKLGEGVCLQGIIAWGIGSPNVIAKKSYMFALTSKPETGDKERI
jgi:hypothetical protein